MKHAVTIVRNIWDPGCAEHVSKARWWEGVASESIEILEIRSITLLMPKGGGREIHRIGVFDHVERQLKLSRGLSAEVILRASSHFYFLRSEDERHRTSNLFLARRRSSLADFIDYCDAVVIDLRVKLCSAYYRANNSFQNFL